MPLQVISRKSLHKWGLLNKEITYMDSVYSHLGFFLHSKRLKFMIGASALELDKVFGPPHMDLSLVVIWPSAFVVHSK